LFAITMIATLGLGIGANTAIFSFVDSMLLRPLPHPDPHELVMIWQDFGSTGGPRREWFTPPDYRDLQTQNRTLEAVTPVLNWVPNLTGMDEPERLLGQFVSTDYFKIAGVQPAIGRGFTESDAQGDGQVVVISHELWQRKFGRDPGVLNRTMLLNGLPFQVIGVMPEGYRAPFAQSDLFRPYLPNTFSAGCGRGCYVIQVLARLRDGVSLEQANADMSTLAAGIREAAPGEKQGMELRVISLQEQLTGPIKPALVALLGAVGLLLLIACVNIANLLLSRSAAREREVAVRTAIGANRGVIVRQLLTESVIIGLIGGAVGVLIAYWGVDLLLRMSPAGTPRLEDVHVDLRALSFALALSTLTGLLFGLFPALQLARVNTSDTLKESGGLRTSASRRRARSALVVAEVAIALTLLAGAGLMMRSFARIQAVDPGFRPEKALATQLILPRAKYPNADAGKAFYAQLMERLRSNPGVESVGLVSILPLSGDNTDVGFLIEGRPLPTNREEANAADYRSITPGYLDAMGISLLRGRRLADTDRPGAPLVALINETLARRYFPNEDPIGKRITTDGPGSEWTTIVGVVADVHHRGPAQPVRPELYLPFEQVPAAAMWTVMRTRAEPIRLAPVVRAELRALDPDLPVARQTTIEDLMKQSVAMPRLFVTFFGFFAAVALLLAAVGIYGVTAHAVSQRTQEIGVRIALGADTGAVVAMIVRQAMLVALIGLILGLTAALLLSRALQSLLFELKPWDPATFASIAAILAAVSLVASWAPARRAASVNPIKALRTE
jgi:putative ABC transport system permease protein